MAESNRTVATALDGWDTSGVATGSWAAMAYKAQSLKGWECSAAAIDFTVIPAQNWRLCDCDIQRGQACTCKE